MIGPPASCRARERRRWTAAISGSFAAHAALATMLFVVPGPPDLAVDETVARVTVLHVGRAVARPARVAARPAEARPATARAPRESAAPAASRSATERFARAATVAARGAARAPAPRAPASGARIDAGAAQPEAAAPTAAGAPSPEPQPTLTAEMLARLNSSMRDALPSAMPRTMKQYGPDLASLAIRADPKRVTAANYPLPLSGLFAHARVARTEHEAIAVRAMRRVGKVYICIGYLAKVPDHAEPIAGPYVGPCKRTWLAQLGVGGEPSPAPSPSPGEEAPGGGMTIITHGA